MKRLISGGFLVLATLGAGFTSAATTTATFQVNATVVKFCSAAATNMGFGTYDPLSGTPLDSTSTVSVTCTKATPFTVALSAGATTGATLAQRRMTNGTDFMQYNLYTTTARTTIWGDGTGSTATVGGTGVNLATPVALTVYGRIPTAQTGLSTGTYTETTITATITY
jgi:spore coat protein U-like protein